MEKITKIKHKNRTPWQRLVLSLFGICIILGVWEWATWHLYSLPEYTITAFTSITTNSFYTIASIIIFMITGKLVFDWKNNTASNLVEQTEHIIENKKEEKTENQNINLNEHIIEEGADGAPLVRPFSQSAYDEEGYDE